MRYISAKPRQVPAGRIIVHNHVKPDVNSKPDGPGFRAWTLPRIELTGGSGEWVGHLEVCKCGWAGLPHYRVRHADTATAG
jgi:hypothetical protein